MEGTGIKTSTLKKLTIPQKIPKMNNPKPTNQKKRNTSHITQHINIIITTTVKQQESTNTAH